VEAIIQYRYLYYIGEDIRKYNIVPGVIRAYIVYYYEVLEPYYSRNRYWGREDIVVPVAS
jgi:hypothetical protein